MQSCINGVRASGATTQMIMVEGTSWTGAWSTYYSTLLLQRVLNRTPQLGPLPETLPLSLASPTPTTTLLLVRLDCTILESVLTFLPSLRDAPVPRL